MYLQGIHAVTVLIYPLSPQQLPSDVYARNGGEQQIGGHALGLVIRVVLLKIKIVDIGEACHEGRAHVFRPPMLERQITAECGKRF